MDNISSKSRREKNIIEIYKVVESWADGAKNAHKISKSNGNLDWCTKEGLTIDKGGYEENDEHKRIEQEGKR